MHTHIRIGVEGQSFKKSISNIYEQLMESKAARRLSISPDVWYQDRVWKLKRSRVWHNGVHCVQASAYTLGVCNEIILYKTAFRLVRRNTDWPGAPYRILCASSSFLLTRSFSFSLFPRVWIYDTYLSATWTRNDLFGEPCDMRRATRLQRGDRYREENPD